MIKLDLAGRQLEHNLDMVGVTGSIPVAPTILLSVVAKVFVLEDPRQLKPSSNRKHTGSIPEAAGANS